jgi:hypothetical protein
MSDEIFRSAVAKLFTAGSRNLITGNWASSMPLHLDAEADISQHETDKRLLENKHSVILYHPIKNVNYNHPFQKSPKSNNTHESITSTNNLLILSPTTRSEDNYSFHLFPGRLREGLPFYMF